MKTQLVSSPYFSRITNSIDLEGGYLNPQEANWQPIGQGLLEPIKNLAITPIQPSKPPKNNSFELNKTFGWLGDKLSGQANLGTQQVACSCPQCSGIVDNSQVFYNSSLSPLEATAASSKDYQINALLSGDKWSNKTITYSFFAGGSYYGSQKGVFPVSTAIKNNVRNILENYIEPLINVNFVEVTDKSSSYGQIRYMFSNGPDYAYAYYPSSDPLGGDIHLNRNYDHSSNTNGFRGSPGTHGFMALIHETLHALGLKHPGNYNGDDPGTPPFLPYDEDNITNTLMSYNFTGNSAATPMPYDIKALQYLYGAKSLNSGSTTYSFNSVYGYTDGSRSWGSATIPMKLTIWDSGGTDTLNFSNLVFDYEGYRLDLNQGGMVTSWSAYNATSYYAESDTSWKTYYTSTYGSAIAFGVRIEKAIGSSSNDTIIGNSLTNVLYGGNGDDNLRGGSGNDSLYGNADNDYLNGGSGNDQVYGSGGNDDLYGSSGNDTLNGASGNDYLSGGTGNDWMYGGSGNDGFVVTSTEDVVIEYANAGIDRVYSSISYTLADNLENLTLTGSAYYGYGNSLNNSITGNSTDNYLYGDSGDDNLYGSSGNDTLTGDSGADKFVFNSLLEGIDTITDFRWIEGDQIQISQVGFGASSTDQFTYNNSTGGLFFDASPFDSIAAQQFAWLESNLGSGFIPSYDIVLV